MSQQNAIYTIPNSKGDLAKIWWMAALVWLAIAVIGLILATQFVARKFGYDAVLGEPIAGNLYSPLAIVGWIFKWWRPDIPADTRDVLSNAILIAVGTSGAGLIAAVALVVHRTRRLKDQENHLHGSAGWATQEDIQASGLLPSDKNRGGCLLGAVDLPVPLRKRLGAATKKLSAGEFTQAKALLFETTQRIYLRHAGPEHILVFAPTRSGKGVGIVVPTLLSWSESVLVHDIKGENFALTSGFRQKVLKQRCLRFAPSEVGSVKFNPLEEIRRDGNIVKDVQNIATMIVDPDGKGLNDHWAKTGFDLLTGVILFVLLCPAIPNAKRSLSTVQAILSDGGIIRELAEEAAKKKNAEEPETGVRAVMEFIRDSGFEALAQAGQLREFERIGWQTAAQAAQSYLNKAPNEASGVLSTALSFLALYRDPIVAENTDSSDFTIESLMQQPSSLYLVVPPSDKDRLKPLIRLIINQVVRRLTESMEFEPGGASKTRYKHRLLLLIDEFPALGKLDVFEEALAFIAGYGLKALLIAQDLSQLQKAYTKDESIVSNCHIRIAYAPNKVETAELLSKMTGQTTVKYEQRNYSGSRLSLLLNNVSTNEQLTQRALLTADECMRLPPDDELVFVAGFKPIYGKKIKYYEDPILSARQRMGPAV
ncbi:type IV secretory system conjugative DNA transfer family protein [Tepidimonas charontis]|uniref:Conjugal transfer protein TraG n=1 Tax=Tepidimonas charontis TaxID=2267262 RepID=A0A554XH41_9BURK|nr:type IV secretory system conjugative DNA transfer family protein [Tepidimonas charontis]TSE35128.1 Conjugal transfer protein TraG [Tepidimonas charontis]